MSDDAGRRLRVSLMDYSDIAACLIKHKLPALCYMLKAEPHQSDKSVAPACRIENTDIHMRILTRFLRTAAILSATLALLALYLLRGGFRRFETTPYPVPAPAFAGWNEALAHPHDISLTTLQTGVVHMDACL